MRWLHRDRITLAGAIEMFGMPRWTVLVFAFLAVAPATAVAVRGGTGLPWSFGAALLAISCCAWVSDEILGALPELLICTAGLGALVPIVVAGGDRLVLAIAWVLVMQATTFGTTFESFAVLGG